MSAPGKQIFIYHVFLKASYLSATLNLLVALKTHLSDGFEKSYDFIDYLGTCLLE